MKKIVQMLLIACMVVLSTQVAFANSDKETIQDGANLVTVKRLAVASPLYQQLDYRFYPTHHPLLASESSET